MSQLLVIDDEESICWGLTQLAKGMGHQVTTASSAEEALGLVRQHKFQAIVLDVRLPGMDGLSAMGALREHVGGTPIIVITAYGDLRTAVTAVRNGAFEYVVKPFNTEDIRQALSRALARAQGTPLDLPAVAAVEGFVGKTAAMQEMFNRIALAAASDTCVLLRGESGTGKELAARAIHKYSARCDGPFVAVNVASLSPTLVESELFGHVRGAFTGADQARTGLLVKANHGTLFLDEIADIPLPSQVKLLRALEAGEVLPVGSDEAVPIELRIISATHRDLLALVQEERFRHDLYFRTSTFQIDLPPLRERRDDIPLLAEYFVDVCARGTARRCGPLSEPVLHELTSRTWQGNVRELRNAIEHALIVARGGPIMPEHLPPPMNLSTGPGGEQEIADAIQNLLIGWTTSQLQAAGGSGELYAQLLALVEPPFLQTLLRKQGGQCAAAARVMGLHRTTLRKKLDLYGLQDETP